MILWVCGSKNCPTHRHKADKCPQGLWFCGRKEPACPGLDHRHDHCPPGKYWSCGARDCPGKHPHHGDKCRDGVWFCGRRQPFCPGHKKPSHSCTVHFYQSQVPHVCAHFHVDPKPYHLEGRKAFFMNAFETRGVPAARRGLMLAMAMIEAWDLSNKWIDHSKDNYLDGSKNVSIFNINADMLKELGYRADAGQQYGAEDWKKYNAVIDSLNDDGQLPIVVGLLNQAFDKWGVEGTMYWVRGGRTTFKEKHHKSFDIHRYQRAVATTLRLMDEDPAWLSDGRRPEMIVVHQDHKPKTPAVANGAAARH